MDTTEDFDYPVSRIMKLRYFFSIAVASVLFSGCARDKEVMVQSTDQTQKRVHTQEELKKTGQTETGPALEQVDPAVQTSRRP